MRSALRQGHLGRTPFRRHQSSSVISAAAYNALVDECAGNQYDLYAVLHQRYGDVLVQEKDEFGVDIVTRVAYTLLCLLLGADHRLR
jgi:hypothetical protein